MNEVLGGGITYWEKKAASYERKKANHLVEEILQFPEHTEDKPKEAHDDGARGAEDAQAQFDGVSRGTYALREFTIRRSEHTHA